MAESYRASIMKNVVRDVEPEPIKDATQKEHLMLSQYYIPWEWPQTKRFKANYSSERDQAMHSAIQYLLGITNITEFIDRYRKPADVQTWYGERLTGQLIGMLQNIIIIVVALGFKGITDTSVVKLPQEEVDRKSLMATVIARLGAGITADGANDAVSKMTWKSFMNRLNVYMKTIIDIEYIYNQRENTITQTINHKWEVMTDSEGDLIVKPAGTPYQPEYRLRYRQRYVDTYNTLLYDDLQKLSLTDIMPELVPQLTPEEQLAQTILDVAKSNI